MNKETEENTCYYKSFAIVCNGMLNTNNRTIKDVPVYGYDLKNGLTSVNNMISVINGNIEFVTEITDAIKVLAIDDIFNCKLCLNGMPVPLLRNCYSIFNGTKYR